MKHFIIYIFCFTSSFLGLAQLKYKLLVVNTDNEPIFKKINYKKEFQTITPLNKEVNSIYISLINEGYMMASVDSLKHDSLNYTAFISAGKKQTWLNLSYNKNQQEVITKLGYNEHFFSKRPFKYTELARLMEKIVVYY